MRRAQGGIEAVLRYSRQPETFGKTTTDGASAARRHFANQ